MEQRRYLIIITVFVAVVLLNIPLPASVRMKVAARDVSAPFQSITTLLFSRIRASGQAVVNLSDRENEKNRFMEEIAMLNLRIKEMEQESRENEHLRDMLDLKKTEKRRLIAAEVTSRGDSSGWWQSISIGKGTDDGVRPGMAVISVAGLVGRVADSVGKHSSDVLLLTDGTMKASCRIQRSGLTGVLCGRGVALSGRAELEMIAPADPFKMTYIDKDGDVVEGDEVVTSGLGGVFPEGILVGYVKTITLDSSGLFKNLDVLPAVDFNDLRYLFAIGGSKENRAK